MIHADHQGIHASWGGYDHESNIHGFHVAVGIAPGDASVTNGFRDYGPVSSAYIDDIVLGDSNNGTLYYVSVKARNNAGAFSTVEVSKPIYVYEENVAGQVFDGRQLFQDQDYSIDKSSIGMSFMGFESAACGIRSYEWALGSHAGYSDITPFSSFGLVMRNSTHGQAELHLPLEHGMTVFVTVRAHTGYKCHEAFIESSSDGMTIDLKTPEVTIETIGIFERVHGSDVLNVYQQDADSIIMEWNSTDESGISNEVWMAGSLPYLSDIVNKTIQENGKVPIGDVSVGSGETVFFTISTIDNSGNQIDTVSPSITIDTSPPVIERDLECTKFISSVYPFVTCTWSDPLDMESPITNVSIGIGRYQFDDSVVEFVSLSHGTTEYTINLESALNTIGPSLFKDHLVVTLKAINIVHLIAASFARVISDETPPVPGIIEVTTPVNPSESISARVCQMSTTTMQLHIKDFKEGESSIER